MQVNIKGIGQVTFPEGTSKEQIQAILTKSFSKKKEGKTFGLREIELMVKGFIKEQVKPADPIVPDVKVDVELEPKFEATMPAIDMKPVADAISSIKSDPQINLTVENPRKVIEIEVTERDTRGFIKKLLCTEIPNVG